MNKKITFFIAGVKFHKLPKIVDQVEKGELLTLERDEGNKYDDFAVKILRSGVMLGHVPMKKQMSFDVSSAMMKGIPLECIVEAVDPKAKPWEMCLVTIRRKGEEDANQSSE